MYAVAFGPQGATPGKLMVFAALVVAAAATGLYAARGARAPMPPMRRESRPGSA
jgi:hypothetical protein